MDAFLHLTLLIDFIVASSNLILALRFISFVASNTLVEQIVFRSTVSSYGTDRYGNKRYGITIPSKLREKSEKLHGKEVIVIVILPDDE